MGELPCSDALAGPQYGHGQQMHPFHERQSAPVASGPKAVPGQVEEREPMRERKELLSRARQVLPRETSGQQLPCEIAGPKISDHGVGTATISRKYRCKRSSCVSSG